MNEINAELLDEQKIWGNKCYKVLKDEYDKKDNEKLSCAFGFGLSDHYIDSKKKIMFVGQVAREHSYDYKEWGPEHWQKWAIDFINIIVYDDRSGHELSERQEKRINEIRNFPFWRFVVKLYELLNREYAFCWNNLDKVTRYCNEGKWVEKELPYEHDRERRILNEKIFDGKSLLRREIEIAEPDLIIFAVGPKDPYYHTLCDTFFDGKDAYGKLLDSYPKINSKPYVEISEKLDLKSPTFYTYHPKYLQIKNKFDDVVAQIAKEIRERTQK